MCDFSRKRGERLLFERQRERETNERLFRERSDTEREREVASRDRGRFDIYRSATTEVSHLFRHLDVKVRFNTTIVVAVQQYTTYVSFLIAVIFCFTVTNFVEREERHCCTCVG